MNTNSNEDTAVPSGETGSALGAYCDNCEESRRWIEGNRYKTTIKLCPKHASHDALVAALQKIFNDFERTCQCECDQDTCCFKVNEPCAKCEARAALALAKPLVSKEQMENTNSDPLNEAKNSGIPRTETKPTRKLTIAQARAVAGETIDAHSFSRYGWSAWCASAQMMARRGLNAKQIEAILRSKWMRRAGDMASSKSPTSKDVELYLDRYRDSECSLANIDRLVAGTI